MTERDAALRPACAAMPRGALHYAQAGAGEPLLLLQGKDVAAEDVAIAEAMVLDHLLGWRSIPSTYEAIFEFDLAQALRRIEAPAVVAKAVLPFLRGH